MEKGFTALGLMSGTSMDGVDAAILRSDGKKVFEHGPVFQLAYDDELRNVLRKALKAAANWRGGAKPLLISDAEEVITDAHIEAVNRLLERAGLEAKDIDFLGFHGQTVVHEPETHLSLQIGDAQALADQTGIDVVADFRSEDLAAGGEGSPLVPLYHQALAQGLEGAKTIAVLNIGGVANVTLVGSDRKLDSLMAFDTGPGNALIDDWMMANIGKPYDESGALASVGKVHGGLVEKLLRHPYFSQTPPKSLDRNAFSIDPIAPLSIEDGAATLAAFTAASVAHAVQHFGHEPDVWIVCGGGRHNAAIMKELSERLAGSVQLAEEVGWRGDDLEAEAFAFLAIRSFLGLPLSLPSTTGVPKPQTGGRLFRAQ
jgi:anhydro-N-acetylmuramic acid kinase